jgi:hypothetical protein
MSLQKIEEFARAPAPGFRCYPAPRDDGRYFIAKLKHFLPGPATSEAIMQIRQMLGDNAEKLVLFYQQHDGFVLYMDTLSKTAGILLLPVENWQEATQDMRSWFKHLAVDPANDPDCIFTGIAIASVPFSGNCFVMPVEGPSAGKVFYADHDGWYETAFADDFDSFLLHVTEDPVRLLNEETGCFARYSDGKTNLQGIPAQYFEDVSRI